MHERPVLLENLFLVRIGSTDPVPHIMTKQCQIGTGGELFAFSDFTEWQQQHVFSVVTVCFFSLGSPLLTVVKSFIPFGNFFALKKRLSDAPKQHRKISAD